LVAQAAKEMQSKFQQGQYLIVEVKYQGSIPPWLNEIMTERGCMKAKFSKYCYSITSALEVA
jgi:hypothetical protein